VKWIALPMNPPSDSLAAVRAIYAELAARPAARFCTGRSEVLSVPAERATPFLASLGAPTLFFVMKNFSPPSRQGQAGDFDFFGSENWPPAFLPNSRPRSDYPVAP
jgi:hypothetical protein